MKNKNTIERRKRKNKERRKRKNKRRHAAATTTTPNPVYLTSTSSDGDVRSSIVVSSPAAEERPVESANCESCVQRGTKRKKIVRSGEDEGDVILCTFFSDLLVSLQSPPSWKHTDVIALHSRMLVAFRNCDKDNCDHDTEDTKVVDLRGLFADEVAEYLITVLGCWTFHPTAKFLNVRVGCKKHGFGKGKLRDMIRQLLEHDEKKIWWELKSEGCIISIKLEDRKYSSLRKYSIDCSQTLSNVLRPQKGKSFSSPNLNASRGGKSFSSPNLNASRGTTRKTPEAKTSLVKLRKRPVSSSTISEPASPFLCDIDTYEFPDIDEPPWNDVSPPKVDFLCTIVCDFMFSFPTPSGYCWDQGIISKILSGLGKCYRDVSYKDMNGSYTIDLRGRCADEAKRLLIEQLNIRPNLRYMKVRVGCEVHGVGEGKLRDMVSDLFQRDQKIKPEFNSDGSIICIKLDGRLDYSSLDWKLTDTDVEDLEHFDDDELIFSPFLNFTCPERTNDDSVGKSVHTDVEETPYVVDCLESLVYSELEEDSYSMFVEAVKSRSSSQNEFLCTIVCDFLCDLPMSLCEGLSEETTLKVLAALEKCNRDTSEKKIEGSYSIDIRGRCVEVAKNVLRDRLVCQSSFEYLDIVVGCKEHGVGNGRLRDVIIAWLEGDLKIKCKFMSKVSIIRIKMSCMPPEIKKMNGKKKGDLYPSDTVYDFSKDFLCTTFCDLLLDLPPPPSWNHLDKMVLSERVSRALQNCNKGYWNKDTEVAKKVDLRGNFADEAIELLITALDSWLRHSTAKYVHVTVGCKKHGMGSGKLKDMLCERLDRDPKKIVWKFVRRFIISIELDHGRANYSSLRGV